MQSAANAEAAALQQLESSAQSLAFSLGVTTTGSLDEVTSEIQRLQQQAGQGATALGGVGNAMQSMAQQATDAMNLLLGDLSPLNDQQKLQKAMQGLYAGTVSKDQVLEIGRRLYASGQQYTDLFNTVMAATGHQAGTGAGGGGMGAQHQGLSAADSQRLKDLLKEQQTLQAAAQLQQYQTLAQQIAEIASSKGEDWHQVLTEMNGSVAAFEKGLGMTDDQTNAYIKAAQDQKDSDGENTQTLINAWGEGVDRIVKAIKGQPVSDGPLTGQTPINITITNPFAGHSQHARPGPARLAVIQ